MKTLSENLYETLSKEDKRIAKLINDLSDLEIAKMLLDKKLNILNIMHLLSLKRAKSIADILDPYLK